MTLMLPFNLLDLRYRVLCWCDRLSLLAVAFWVVFIAFAVALAFAPLVACSDWAAALSAFLMTLAAASASRVGRRHRRPACAVGVRGGSACVWLL
jgi:hypothetical protein